MNSSFRTIPVNSSFKTLLTNSSFRTLLTNSSFRTLPMDSSFRILPMCEPNQHIRAERAQQFNQSFVNCLAFNCYNLYGKYHTASLQNHEVTCSKTVVEKCSEYNVKDLRTTDLCTQQFKDDHAKIAVEKSSNIFFGVRTHTGNHASRIPLLMLTWMQAVYKPEQVCCCMLYI